MKAIGSLSGLGGAELYAVGTAISTAVTLGRTTWGPGAAEAARAFFDDVAEFCYVKTFPSFARPDCMDQEIAYVTALAACEKKTGEARRQCERDAESTKGAAALACEMARWDELVRARPRIPIPGPTPRPGPIPWPFAVAVLGALVLVEALVIFAQSRGDLIVR